MTEKEQREVSIALRNLISFRLKENNAPVASEEHFYSAIYGLTQLIPKFDLEEYIKYLSEEDKAEMRELFSLAKEVVENYNPFRKS